MNAPRPALRPLDDALAALLAQAQPLAGTQSVPTFEADGRVSSCITIASAPAGTGAPVKMRAAVAGCSGGGAAPAGMRWLTGSTTPSSAISLLRTA